MISSSSIAINFNNNVAYPKNFPRSLNLSESDELSALTYEEELARSQAACMPYYSIAIVELNSTSQNSQAEKIYRIYDAAHFTTTISNQPKKNELIQDPVTSLPIQKIYYFALKCFDVDEKDICKPVEFTNTKHVFQFIPTEGNNLDINKMLMDSFNVNIMETGNCSQKLSVRRTQLIVADLIQKTDLFKQLNIKENERKQEAILWLWCSAQGSIRSSIKLVQACLENGELAFKCRKPLFNILRKDRIQELQNMLRQLTPKQKNLELGEIKQIHDLRNQLHKLKPSSTSPRCSKLNNCRNN